VNRITDPQLQQAEGEAVAAVAQAAQFGDVQKVQVRFMQAVACSGSARGNSKPHRGMQRKQHPAALPMLLGAPLRRCSLASVAAPGAPAALCWLRTAASCNK
jgi:hypothetical protein